MTFSIVAANPGSGEIGVAVASKFIAAGSLVPWVQLGVGAVATQSWANVNSALLCSGCSNSGTLPGGLSRWF